MRISKERYIARKKEVEEALREYPYNLISLETPGLGSATRWDIVKVKDTMPSGSNVEMYVEDAEILKARVNKIDKVLDLLDQESKSIIELVYFRDTYSVKEVLDKLNMDRNKFYKLKNKALGKFILSMYTN